MPGLDKGDIKINLTEDKLDAQETINAFSYPAAEIDKLISLAFILLCVIKNKSQEISHHNDYYSFKSIVDRYVYC